MFCSPDDYVGLMDEKEIKKQNSKEVDAERKRKIEADKKKKAFMKGNFILPKFVSKEFH